MKKIFGIVLFVFLLVGCTDAKTNNEKEAINLDKLNPKQVVVIKDAELEAIIREMIAKPEGDILAVDMEEVHSLNINFNNTPVRDISGLEYAVNLSDFSYRYGDSLVSLDPIRSCKELTYLNMSYSKIDSQPAAFNTPSLERINFTDSNISDYNFLKNVTSAISLTLINNNIDSIDFIEDMAKLESVNLSTNKISDISPLKDKVNLTSVTLHQNQVSSISALEKCTKLEDVNISYNHVTNLEPLFNKENLSLITAYEELDQKIIDRGQISTLIASGVEVNYHN